MNSNKNLFWYGFFGNIKKAFGKLFILMGIVSLMFSLFINSNGWLFAIVFLGLGIFLLSKGSSQRFDYQRQSGYIMHRGD